VIINVAPLLRDEVGAQANFSVAEDPIDPATVEPEATQAGLQVGNVVAAQVR